MKNTTGCDYEFAPPPRSAAMVRIKLNRFKFQPFDKNLTTLFLFCRYAARRAHLGVTELSGRRRNGAPSESWVVRKDQHVLSCGTDREPRFGDGERAPTNAHGRRGARVLGLWSAEVGPACRISAKEGRVWSGFCQMAET